MTLQRSCGYPTGKTVTCRKVAISTGGRFWKCDAGHFLPEDRSLPRSEIAVTARGAMEAIEDTLPQPELIPEPPSGPRVEPFDYTSSRWLAGELFAGSPPGRRFWDALKQDALKSFMHGARRYSVRWFLEDYRKLHALRINNVFAPWFADALILRYPDLADVVERRRRDKPGPDPSRFLAILEAGS